MTAGFLSLTCVLQAMANSFASENTTPYENMESTFGFGSSNMADSMSDEEKLQYAYKDRESKANYIVESQRKMEAAQKRREIRHQQSLIFIAKQKLNGKNSCLWRREKGFRENYKKC